jgi:hypothetical protein
VSLDREGLVRHHAARGLLALHGLPDDSEDPQHMMYRVMSDDADRREGGKRDILAAIAGPAHPRAMTAPPMSQRVESFSREFSANGACNPPKKRPPNVVRRSKPPGNASWCHRILTQTY